MGLCNALISTSMHFTAKFRFNHANPLAILNEQAVKRGATSRDFLKRLLLNSHGYAPFLQMVLIQTFK